MKILYRPATLVDAKGMLEIYAPYALQTTITWEKSAPALKEFKSRMRIGLNDGYPYLVAMDRENVAAYAYASPFRDRFGYRFSCESTIYVHSSYHRTGIGRELYKRLLRVLAVQGFRTVVAGIGLPGYGSVPFHESIGFKHVGTFEDIGSKFDKRLSLALYCYELSTDTHPNIERPLNFMNIQDSECVKSILVSPDSV